jgi:hypothetical protein
MKTKKKKTPPAPPATSAPPATPRSHRELGQAILAECDLVKAGSELLNAGSESVKMRALETIADWSFGKPPSAAAETAAQKPAVRVIWDIPAPPHEA